MQYKSYVCSVHFDNKHKQYQITSSTTEHLSFPWHSGTQPIRWKCAIKPGYTITGTGFCHHTDTIHLCVLQCMSLPFHIRAASAVHHQSQSWRTGTRGTQWLDHGTCMIPDRVTTHTNVTEFSGISQYYLNPSKVHYNTTASSHSWHTH